jgi:hypothetical protein
MDEARQRGSELDLAEAESRQIGVGIGAPGSLFLSLLD